MKHYEWGGPMGPSNNWTYSFLWLRQDGLVWNSSQFYGQAARTPTEYEFQHQLGELSLEEQIIKLLAWGGFPQCDAELRRLYERSVRTRFADKPYDHDYMMGLLPSPLQGD